MKKYNYFYFGQAITKTQFINNVPSNWQNEVEYGVFTFGAYKAVELEENQF